MGQTTLSVTQMPSHKHDLQWAQTNLGAEGLIGGAAPALRGQFIANTGGSESHTHSFTNATSNSANNLPLYYALSLIMRVA